MQLFRPEPSHLASKTYKVWILRNGKPKLIHFGSRMHKHYFDKLGTYSTQNHNDERKREAGWLAGWLARNKHHT